MPDTESSAHSTSAPSTDRFDVVVIGGGFAGSSTALLLRRRLPNARILVAERSEVFHRKVGEATVEVSACFLHRVLEIFDHLSREHLPKHGLRFWFSDGGDRELAEMTEIGPDEAPRLPSFQLERPVLDQYLLDLAVDAGIEVVRPAKVKAVDVEPDADALWPRNTVDLDTPDGPRRVEARWVVDASGRQSFLARKLGLHRKVDSHPTASIWARWRGAADLDSHDVVGGPQSPRLGPIAASRRLATNHFLGYGFWSWVIPLANGNTSIGLVYNKDLYEPPEGANLRQRYEAFVRSTPGLRDLVRDADIDDDDFMALSHLPYVSERYMDRGWALVADAAAFIDPFYSPGLDHASISIWATVQILERHLRGTMDDAALDQRIAEHNRDFLRSYERWLDGLYIGKYELMGDADLMNAAYLTDTALYYLGVVTPVYRNLDALSNPIFGIELPQAKWAYRTIRLFNRRLLKLARFRRQVGTYGRNNLGQRRFGGSFGLGAASVPHLVRGIRIWLGIELERLWHLVRRGRVDESAPVESEPSDLPEPAVAVGG